MYGQVYTDSDAASVRLGSHTGITHLLKATYLQLPVYLHLTEFVPEQKAGRISKQTQYFIPE